MKITVIGSINTDLVINTARIPKIGETISGSGFSVNCGGKGANQAVAVAKLGGEVSFIGAVGDDANGEISLKNLKDNGVDINGISVVDVNTGVAVITVCNGDNSIILDAGANGVVTKELIDKHKSIIENSDAVIMQLEIPMETVCYVSSVAKKAGVKVILNPAPIRDLPDELLLNTDILILNETEAEYISGIFPDTDETRRECIKRIQKAGVENVIITLGGDGSVYTDNGEIKYRKAFKAEVVDTTAAGDTFIGAYCLKMNEGTDYAVKYSTAASSITVSRAGASKSIPCENEVESLLESLKD